jgi:putative ABC transport system permease protein
MRERLCNAVESTAQDVRYGARGLRRNPGFALTAILLIAIGIGATTAMFSVVDRLLFRSLPYGNGDRLVSVGIRHPLMDGEFLIANDYLYLREKLEGDQTPFAAVTSWTGVADCDLTEQNPLRLACAQVEWSFLPTFGVAPLAGRNFTLDDDRQYAPTVALISYRLWQSRFAGEARALGSTLMVDGAPVKVIGVLPRDFELPTLERADLLVPQALHMAHYSPNDTGRPLHVFGRLKDGVTMERARSMLQPFFQFAIEHFLGSGRMRQQATVALHSIRDFQIHDVRLASWILFGATLAVLLIVCANVANLLLARFAGRRREFAMRRALGAGHGRLVRQTLTESLLLCGFGAAAGCALAWAMLSVLRAAAPRGIPRIAQASLDGRVLLFTLAAMLVCGLALGLAPAFSSLTPEALAGWRAAGSSRHGLRHALAAAQIAVSLVLLADAGLLIESLWNMTRLSPGVDTDQVVTTDITVGAPRYATSAQRQRFFDDLTERLRAIPLIASVAVSDSVPPSAPTHNHPLSGMHVAGRAPGEPGAGGVVWRRTVSPAYFAAVGTPVVRGRGFRKEDLTSTENVMVISATLARRLFPNEDPIGRAVDIPAGRWKNVTVIGVAADTENTGVPGQSEPEYYLLRRPGPPPFATPTAPPRGNDALLGGDASLIARALHIYDGEGYLIVRSPARADAVAQWIRSEAAALDATVPVTIATMRQRVRSLSERPRFDAFLLSLFAGIGVALAAFGLYGLLGFLVVQRTQEIGVRVALGATPRNVAKLVLRDGLRWTAAGVALGLGGAIVTAQSLGGLLFGIRPENPVAFAVSAGVLIAVAMVAMLSPALRAARIDPLEALRRE